MTRRRTALILAEALGALIAGLAVLAVLAAWRLASAPITVTALTPYLTPALEALAGGLHISVGETQATWGGFEDPLVLRLRNVRIAAAAGQAVATIPELAVDLSARALLGGRVALARVTVVGPTLHLERTRDGAVMLDLEGGQEGQTQGAVALPVTVAEHDPGLAAGLLDLLRRPADGVGPLGALSQVAVRGATVTLDDRIAGVVWSVPDADLEARRGTDGLQAAARVELRLPGGSAVFELHVDGVRDVAASTGTATGAATTATLRFQGLDASALAPALPTLPALAGLHLPLDGSLSAGFDRDLRLLSLTLTATDGEGGTLDLPALRPEPIEVAALAITAAFDPVAGRISVGHARLEASNPALSLGLSGEIAGSLAAPTGALTLVLAAGAEPADTEAPARIEAHLNAADGGAQTLTLRLAGLEPARLAGLAPALAGLAAAAVPVAGTVEVGFEAGWQPARLALDLTAGPGRLVLPALMPDPVPIAGLTLVAQAQAPFLPVPAHLALTTLAADFGGPRLRFGGSVTRTGDRLAMIADLKTEMVPAASLPRLWPPKVGKNARDWITANIRAGMIDQAWLHVDGSAPVADPGDVLATTLDGGVDASDLTVSYFKTLPPITGISGHGTTDGRSFILATTGGHIGELAVGDARIDISKLDTPQEWIDIDAPISGSIRATLAVLDTPPLRYAHRVDIDPAKTEGNQSCRLHFYFPLKKGIDIENVDLGANAMLHGAAVDGIAGGIAVSQGELKLALDGTGMDVTGTARLDGLPAAIRWRENFRDAADPRTRVAVKAEITDRDLAGYGVTPAPYLTGRLGADLQLVIDHARHTRLSGGLDLAATRLDLAALGWTKPVGTPGSARFAVEFEAGKPVRISGIALESAGLSALGAVDLAAGGLGRVRLEHLRLGANDLGAEVLPRAGGGYDVTLRGASFDARPLLKESGDAQARQQRRAERLARRNQAPPPPGPPYTVSLKIDRVIAGDDQRGLTDLRGEVASTGQGWDRATLDAGIAGGTTDVALRYLPEGERRRLTVTSGNAGALLHALDLTDSLQGGRLSVNASGPPGFPVRPIAGHLSLGEYRVVDAPLLARILHALSVTGVIEALNGQGLAFSQLESDLGWDRDAITLSDLKTSGGALGLTLAGKIDLAADTLAVQGTIVPVYSLNRILGMVPVLGDLISGGSGQGLFAATYYLTGALDHPDVSVNPLAVLAPGFLRNLFFLDSDAGRGPAEAPQPAPP